MVERDQRLATSINQPFEHVPVTANGVIVPFAGFRLDAAPFDGQAVGIVAHVRSAIKVLAVAPAPPVAGQSRFMVPENAPVRLLPLPPVVGVLPFDLV